MRIRKRQVPLPLSSLTPVPLSDPLLSRSPGVQLRPHDNSSLHHLAQEADRLSHLDSPPSDQRNQPIVAGSTDQDRSRDGGGGSPEVKEVLPEKKDERDGEEEKRSNDAWKGTCLGAKIGTMVSRQPTSSSAQVLGSWCEGEKSFPVKKRVGASFERRSRVETIMEKHKKMKTKMNKKCVAQNGNEEGGKEDIESKDAVDGGTTSGKKRGRGGALLEGSRCSRVNGRGWRCCQQTLVGYSLCEHHLGKGRLRSMNSVRSRSAPKKAETGQQISGPSSTEEKERKGAVSSCKLEGGERAGDEKQPLMISNKKMKLGMVKARSISSLLGQANDTVEVTDSYN